MKWVYPEFLYALAILAIPILIHLLNFRRFKKVRFTNVRFLREVKQENRSRNRLRNLLVLLMRLLAFSLLVFAFAQPYVPGQANGITGNKAVSFYLDNSFSMDAVSSDGRLLELAKQSIGKKVKHFNAADKFQLITNDFESRHQRLLNREDFLELLDEVKISPASRSLAEVLFRQYDVLSNSNAVSKQSFLLTDFQKSVTNWAEIKTDSSVQVVCIPLQAQEKSNVYVDSVWFDHPVRQLNQQEALNVRLVNTGKNTLNNLPLKLFINGQQKALGSFSIAPGGTVDTVLRFTHTTPGIQRAEVAITDHPITFDDRYYFSYKVADRIFVLNIKDSRNDAAQSYIAPVFKNDAFYLFQQTGDRNIDYSRLGEFNLIVLENLPEISSGMARELARFVENGGSLFVVPSANIDVQSYNDLFGLVRANPYQKLDTTRQKVVKINLDHPVYRNVFEMVPENIDLPVVLQHYSIRQSIRSGQEFLLRLQNGAPFLTGYDHGKGKVYVSSVSLSSDFSNFTRHAIYVTSLLRMAELSVPSGKLFYVIGRDGSTELSGFNTSGEHAFKVKHPDNGFEFIASHRSVGGRTSVLLHHRIQEAGNYQLEWNKEAVAGLGFNYPRTESELEALSKNDIKAAIETYRLTNFSIADINTSARGMGSVRPDETPLWKWCIIFVLIFLGLEVLLLRLWKG